MSSKSQSELGSESKPDGVKVKVEVCVDSVESALASVRIPALFFFRPIDDDDCLLRSSDLTLTITDETSQF